MVNSCAQPNTMPSESNNYLINTLAVEDPTDKYAGFAHITMNCRSYEGQINCLSLPEIDASS